MMNKPEMLRTPGSNTMLGATRLPEEHRAKQPEPMKHTRKAFEQMGKLKAPGKPFFDRFFDRMLPSLPDAQRLDWGDEADWALLQQEPVRARWMLRIMCFVVLLLLVWSAFAELDEVTRGDGKVIPTSQLQVVQAADQGRIKELLITEGQTVEKGQTLLRIDTSRFESELGSTTAELLNLTAKMARLQALIDGKPFVVPEEVLSGAPLIASQERDLYASSINEAEAQLSVTRQQLTQREQELREVRALHTQAANGLKLAEQELKKNEPLVKSGAVSEVEIIRLQQNVEKFDGDRRQAEERIGRAQAAIAEAQNKLREVELNRLNQWRKELSEARTRFDTLTEGAGVIRDKVDQADVRSPVRGTVNRLLVNTIGGVVQQGKDLVEIVPLGEKLLLETKIKPKDAGFLSVGMPVRVKITAYDYSIYGGLDGRLDLISNDTVTDDKGNTFYIIKVSTYKSTLADNKQITPGMLAEVDILTGKKTVLEYLLKPVLKARSKAMTEH